MQTGVFGDYFRHSPPPKCNYVYVFNEPGGMLCDRIKVYAPSQDEAWDYLEEAVPNASYRMSLVDQYTPIGINAEFGVMA